MNFRYLAEKYLNVSCLVNDRTYDGIIWPHDAPMEKPPLEVFEAFQREEDRLKRVDQFTTESLMADHREKLHQARAKALEEITPYEDKLRAEQEDVRRQALEQKQEAVRLRLALELRETADHMWTEISRTEAAMAAQAQKYLEDTAFYLAWDPHKIPADVLAKREEAHKRLEAGKTVYANWQSLRAKEHPSREEMAAAIRAGGEELERMKALLKGVALRYPKPKQHH